MKMIKNWINSAYNGATNMITLSLFLGLCILIAVKTPLLLIIRLLDFYPLYPLVAGLMACLFFMVKNCILSDKAFYLSFKEYIIVFAIGSSISLLVLICRTYFEIFILIVPLLHIFLNFLELTPIFFVSIGGSVKNSIKSLADFTIIKMEGDNSSKSIGNNSEGESSKRPIKDISESDKPKRESALEISKRIEALTKSAFKEFLEKNNSGLEKNKLEDSSLLTKDKLEEIKTRIEKPVSLKEAHESLKRTLDSAGKYLEDQKAEMLEKAYQDKAKVLAEVETEARPLLNQLNKLKQDMLKVQTTNDIKVIQTSDMGLEIDVPHDMTAEKYQNLSLRVKIIDTSFFQQLDKAKALADKADAKIKRFNSLHKDLKDKQVEQNNVKSELDKVLAEYDELIITD